MLIDDQITKYVNDRFPRTDDIRRIENGSIDYDHYLKIGREARGAAFRQTSRSSKGLFQRSFDTMAFWRQAPQEVEHSATTFVFAEHVQLRGDKQNDPADQAIQSLSEAA